MKKKVYTAPEFTCFQIECKDLIATSSIGGGEGAPSGTTEARPLFMEVDDFLDW